jgi:hypothetical protein
VSKQSPWKKQTYCWRIFQLGAHGEVVGDVEAPDAEAAIKKAIEQFEITEPWRQRALLAKRYA